MKLILTLFSSLIIGILFSQQNYFNALCNEIQIHDDAIYQSDYDIDYSKFKKNRLEGPSIRSELKQLAATLEIDAANFNPVKFRLALDCIETPETITWLEFYMDSILIYSKQADAQNENQSLSARKNTLSILHQRTNELIQEQFAYYGFTRSTKKWVKGIFVEHGNDVLAPYNDDRDLTGSLRVELFTDRLKIRLFDGAWQSIFNLNGRNWYSYQSVFLGAEAYTPYLRDTTTFFEPMSVDTLDRPYGSFTYLGYAKYRITRRGRLRSVSQFKFGTIGGDRPNAAQSLLHRDVVSSSQKPNGWDAQIAAGGRLGFSYSLLAEWAAAKSPLAPWYARGLTLLGFGEIGHDKTYAGIGIGWHNQTLRERGGLRCSPFVGQLFL